MRLLVRAARVLHARTATSALARARRPRAAFFYSSAERNSADTQDKDWSELSPDVQERWRTLGWDEQSWEQGSGAHTEDKYWDELSEDERRAAKKLGFDEDSWENDSEFEYVIGCVLMLALYMGYYLYEEMQEEKKWKKTKLSKRDRTDIAEWVKYFADSHTDKTWLDKDNYEKTLDKSAMAIMAAIRDIFIQLAEDEEPRHVITRNSWLTHTNGAASESSRSVSLSLFNLMDVDHDEHIDFHEFAKFMMMMVVGTDPNVDPTAFAELLFVMIDEDCNGELTEEEVDAFLDLATCAGMDSFIGVSASDLFYDAATKANRVTELTTLSKQEFVETIGPKLAEDFVGHMEPELVPKEVAEFQSTWTTCICNGTLAQVWTQTQHYGRIGTGGGGGGGCFAPGTQVITPKGAVSIEDLRPGDETVAGGRVKATLQFDQQACAPLFDYRGIIVTGDHAVDSGEHHFVRVKNAIGARQLVDAPPGNLVHDLITTDHRILVAGRDGEVVVFADYEEVQEGEEEYNVLLRHLNKEIRVP